MATFLSFYYLRCKTPKDNKTLVTFAENEESDTLIYCAVINVAAHVQQPNENKDIKGQL